MPGLKIDKNGFPLYVAEEALKAKTYHVLFDHKNRTNPKKAHTLAEAFQQAVENCQKIRSK